MVAIYNTIHVAIAWQSQEIVDRYVIVYLAVHDGGIVAIHQLIKLALIN